VGITDSDTYWFSHGLLFSIFFETGTSGKRIHTLPLRKLIIDYIIEKLPHIDIEPCNDDNIINLFTNAPRPNGTLTFYRDLFNELEYAFSEYELTMEIGGVNTTWENIPINKIFEETWEENKHFYGCRLNHSNITSKQTFIERSQQLYESQADIVKKALDEFETLDKLRTYWSNIVVICKNAIGKFSANHPIRSYGKGHNKFNQLQQSKDSNRRK
jgi:hypothetical protein